MKIWAGLVFAALTFAASAVAAEDQTIKVMVLGTYHMANPGNDIHNANVDDVTTPEKQKQLEDVARRLAKFKPTKIALEGDATTDDFTSAKYHSFTPEDLKTNRDERIQVGYRLAYKLAHKDVYLIDESSDLIDYFPYGKVLEYVEEKGETPALEALNAKIAAKVKAFNDAQSKKTVAQLLAQMNDPEAVRSEHNGFHYGLLNFADLKSQPGAELNAYWYMRNAKIFSKLIQVAEPGDRIIVVFGAGHAFWLRHFAENTPGFELVEPNDYLR